MKKPFESLALWVGLYGEFVGLSLVALVSAWDFCCVGIRKLFHYSIGWKGILIIWFGIILICAGKRLARTWGR